MPEFEAIQAIWLTIKLASIVTLILLFFGTPIAWWLSYKENFLKKIIGAIITMPLVLPPSVLGFYLLIAMGPDGPIGKFTDFFGLEQFSFSFTGLVIGSIFYSLPFMIQPLQNTFENIGKTPIEIAATLRASPIDAFFSVIVPLSKPGFITAIVMTFAHTIGEFGVVLMIGGNIPNETKVASIQIYDYVEALEYSQAHNLSIILLIFSFVVLIALRIFSPIKQYNIK
tara:strand:+ start:640 stop:1320 length:681 start_codon:yes stop_codon:yes gene_type:complete